MQTLLQLRSATPPWWTAAPLPDAALYVARRNGLDSLDGRSAAAAEPELLEILSADGSPGQIIFARDASGETWRFRRRWAAGQAQLWQLQSLEDSRERLHVRLRSLLGSRLVDRVLHELRNPLNAVSLHADLLERILQETPPAELRQRASPSVEVIKRRLQELRRLQDAAALRWLAGADPEGAPTGFGAVVADSVRLLRGGFSLQNISLRAESLDRLDRLPLNRGASRVQMVVIALLSMAAAAVQHTKGADDDGELVLRGCDGAALELAAPLDCRSLGHDWVEADTAATLAGLALLVEPDGLHLTVSTQPPLVRLSPAAR
jgi:signal transduction histidine kinase